MNKKFCYFLWAILLVNLIIYPWGAADAVFLPTNGYFMEEPKQEAVIFYENGQETLILSPAFRGNSDDFVWLIPVPNRPEVASVASEVFTQLALFTTPSHTATWQAVPFGFFRPAEVYFEDYEEEAQAEVITVAQKQIEYYDVLVLNSDDPYALSDWLKNHGYAASADLIDSLDDYIDEEWHFILVRYDASRGVNNSLWQGTAQPLKISFASPKILYPFKLNSAKGVFNSENFTDEINEEELAEEPVLAMWTAEDEEIDEEMIEEMGEENEEGEITESDWMIVPAVPRASQTTALTLYVFADRQMTIPGFQTEYSDFVKKENIDSLAPSLSALQLNNKKYFLTKLTNTFSLRQVDSDLVLQPSAEKGISLDKKQQYYLLLTIISGLVSIILLYRLFRAIK